MIIKKDEQKVEQLKRKRVKKKELKCGYFFMLSLSFTILIAMLCPLRSGPGAPRLSSRSKCNYDYAFLLLEHVTS